LHHRLAGKVSVTWVENPDYHKSNGISALAAKDEIKSNFLLLMADHLFEAETAKALCRQRLGQGEVILGVDPHIDRIFDLDDATKVQRQGDHIVDIGKELQRYDALDTGMFLCSTALFDKLESATTNGNCSLSDGMRLLAANRKLRAFEIDSDWQDVDTPEALAHAENVFEWSLHSEAATERLSSV
jgi:choline kinase